MRFDISVFSPLFTVSLSIYIWKGTKTRQVGCGGSLRDEQAPGWGRHCEPQRRIIALGQIFRSVAFCYTLAENIIRQCFHYAELINMADPSHLTLARASPLLSQREQSRRGGKGKRSGSALRGALIYT